MSIDLETCNAKTFKDFINTLKKDWPVFVSTRGIDRILFNLDERVSKYNTNKKDISRFHKKVEQIIPKHNPNELDDKIYYNDKYKILYNSKTKEAFVLQKPHKFFVRKFS